MSATNRSSGSCTIEPRRRDSPGGRRSSPPTAKGRSIFSARPRGCVPRRRRPWSMASAISARRASLSSEWPAASMRARRMAISVREMVPRRRGRVDQIRRAGEGRGLRGAHRSPAVTEARLGRRERRDRRDEGARAGGDGIDRTDRAADGGDTRCSSAGGGGGSSRSFGGGGRGARGRPSRQPAAPGALRPPGSAPGPPRPGRARDARSGPMPPAASIVPRDSAATTRTETRHAAPASHASSAGRQVRLIFQTSNALCPNQR